MTIGDDYLEECHSVDIDAFRKLKKPTTYAIPIWENTKCKSFLKYMSDFNKKHGIKEESAIKELKEGLS